MAEPLYSPHAGARKVIAAASAATVFEWYDFYLYAVLAPFFAKLFFPAQDETAALFAAFAAYAAGFVVRPLGALALGRLGDLAGRKYAFLISIVLMGFSTFTIGLLPAFDELGWIAPLLLVLLRLMQGFALGGQYGGAVLFAAEYTPAERRGAATGWIQTTATLGLLLALAVIGVCRVFLPAGEFEAWGWRLPFLAATLLLIVTVSLATSMRETPVYQAVKAEGRRSKFPLWESFVQWPNNKYVFLALLGATAGQGVVWYTGQFYALFFLTITLHLDYLTAYLLVGAALAAGTPFFVLTGSLSDKVGRLKVILAGCLLAAVSYIPLFHVISLAVNPELASFQVNNPITVRVDERTCGFHVFVGPWSRYSACDRVTDYLTSLGLSFKKVNVTGMDAAEVMIGAQTIAIGGSGKAEAERSLQNSLFGVGYPGLAWKYLDGEPQVDTQGAPVLELKKADPALVNYPVAFLALLTLMFYVTLVYGPMAAFLVELFPAQVRYTAISFPYHIGNGVFGGLLPLLAAALVTVTGNIYAGLWYPIAVAGGTFVIGMLFLRKRRQMLE
jgi:predicted MFS family arabinose efflux permease